MTNMLRLLGRNDQLEQYRRAFARLRTDTSPARWSADTCHRAPHKLLLLLAVMDLIEQGVIRTNLIELDATLIDTFDLYWRAVMGPERYANVVLPFYHLHSDKFWHLVPVPTMEGLLPIVRQIRTMSQLRQLVIGARLDDALYNLLHHQESRDTLRRTLIETYFAPNIRPKLVEIAHITAESFQYSRRLVAESKRPFRLRETVDEADQYHPESRSTAFRRIVVESYNQMCAMCGVRIVTPEGRTAVAAAHIVPWSLSHNDDPRNGMALCGLHHWTFDQGVTSIAPDYTIDVSPLIEAHAETAQSLLSLAKQRLHRPADSTLWPAKRAIEWHRRHIFRAETPTRQI